MFRALSRTSSALLKVAEHSVSITKIAGQDSKFLPCIWTTSANRKFLPAFSRSWNSPFHPELHEYWENFKTVYGKTYKNSHEERKRRLIWEDRVVQISLTNLKADMGLVSFRMGMNRFGDLTPEDFPRLPQDIEDIIDYHLPENNASENGTLENKS